MDFIALDVETANHSHSSICQIGLAEFKNGALHSSWSTLVDPEDYFEPINVKIHNIDESKVAGSPTFSEIANILNSRIAGSVVVHHMPFDKSAMRQVHEKYQLELPECQWLDSALVVRRAWSEFSKKGYGLANITQHLGITFEHHDAEEDARAAGLVLLRALEHSGASLNDWILNTQKKKSRHSRDSQERQIACEGDPEGQFYGEVLVFTGTLSQPKADLAQLASSVGYTVEKNVTKKTTTLVVGEQDLRKLAGHDKSDKHRYAERLIEKGLPIRIMQEPDFMNIVFETSGG